ncbi:T9SS type A sorting domain-containing protein [bacterium]|nr:T9SS type A sorting domain-containing protein [bacterium]
MKKLLLTLFCLFAMFTVKAQCDYSVDLTDSWGDGWSSVTVDVLVDGVVVLDDKNTNASISSYTLPVNDGSSITMVWNGDETYTNEIGWRIRDVNGSIVASGAYNVTPSNLNAVCPSCAGAIATMSAITATGATATWAAALGAASYDWEVVPTGNAQGTGVVASGTATTFSGNVASITGLTANTGYDFLISSDCTDDYASAVSFTTLCNAYTIPYTEGFETGYTNGSAVGGCLTQESTIGTETWTANSTATSYNRSPRTGSFNAYLRYSNTDWMFIAVSLTGGQSYDFEMYARQDGSGSTNSNITVSYGDAAAAASMTNSIVAETGIINGDYQQIAGSFTPSATATYYIGVKGYMNGSPWYISIDDISIEESPACAAPVGLEIAAVTADTASASWTAATGALSYEYELVDVTAGGTATGTPTGSSATETLTIGSLIEGNQYGILIRTLCARETQSAWSTQVNWTNILAPDCVTNLSPADGSTSAPVVVLTWDAPTTGPTVVDYEVFTSTDNITFISIGTTTATSTETAFNANATAYYKVEARNAGGSSESCSVQTITTNQDGLDCATPIIDNEGTNYQTYLKYYGQYSSQYSSYTTTTAGNLDIGSCGAGQDTTLYVYDTNCVLLYNAGDNCATGTGTNYASFVNFDVLPNVEYIIRWYGNYSISDFAYEITLTPTCSGTTTTWDGTAWSNGAPDANSYAIISGAYSTGTDGDVTACVMQVDASVTIDGTTDAAISEVLVMAGNTLTIDETSSLTVSGDFTNNGTVTLNSTADDFSSLIVTGTASGDIVYNRYVNVYDDTLGGGWDLVCSPVGMSIADFITANGSNIQVLGDDYAFSQFNNATGQWERYATASQTGNFEAGKGYSMATTGGSTVAFTGAMQTADQSINIINNNGLNGVGRRWNLVSNPFPSYINGNAAAGTNNFMDANAAVIDSEFLAVYGWNGSSYTIYNNLTTGADTDTPAFSMAPGQGFWVAALNTTDTALSFTAAMRTTTGTGDFVSSPQLLTYNVAVKLYNGEIEKAATNFYFRDGLSLDLDPGYDAAAFNQSMALSTRLPQGSQETAFGINAMGMDAMQNTRVPLEIRQNAGQAFRVSIADMELPEDIYVYLEDTLNGTLTSLKDGDFELVAQSNLSGSDRFFIVFKSNSVLSNGDTLGINALNVYKANTDSFVTIAGISPELGKLNVSLYNILGQTVREKALSSATATQRVSTQGLASGLYIVQIRSGNQTTVKKIIIK